MAKEKKNVYTGTGHRKTSVARVTLTPGKGKITVNGMDVHEYLPFEVLIMDLYLLCKKKEGRRFNINKSFSKRNSKKDAITYYIKNK